MKHDAYKDYGFSFSIRCVDNEAYSQVSPGFPTDNPYVKAIPLRQDFAVKGLACTVSGWGLLGDPDKTRPQILQVVNVPFIPQDICRHIYRNYTKGSIEPGMNCAGYLEGGKDACNVSTAYVAPVRTDVSEERVASMIKVIRIGMLRLLVTVNVIPSSPILLTLLMEAIGSSETSVLTRTTGRNIPEDGILR
jgi:hypothetical protein